MNTSMRFATSSVRGKVARNALVWSLQSSIVAPGTSMLAQNVIGIRTGASGKKGRAYRALQMKVK